MDSDADSSNILPLPTIDSTETESKRGRTLTAQSTWAHTRPAHDGEDQFHKGRPIQYCIHCTEQSYGTFITTNMQKHLKSKHQISIDPILSLLQEATINQLQQLYLKAKSSGQK